MASSLDVNKPDYQITIPIATDDGEKFAGEDYKKYLPLHRAIMSGNWTRAEVELGKHRETRTAIISDSGETVLHVAMEVGKKSNGFVKKLLESMPDDAVLRKNSRGNTALHRAATIGDKEAVTMLVNKKHELLYILNHSNRLPVHEAAIHRHKRTLMYLISVSESDVENSPFVGHLGASLLGLVIVSQFTDVALYLMTQYPHLATTLNTDPPLATTLNTDPDVALYLMKTYPRLATTLNMDLPLATTTNTDPDMALYLIKKYPPLATTPNTDTPLATTPNMPKREGLYPLEVIASSDHVFYSGLCVRNWWKKWIYSCVIWMSTMMSNNNDIIKNMSFKKSQKMNMSFNDGEDKACGWIPIIGTIISFVRSVMEKDAMHKNAVELVKCSCKELETLPSSVAASIYRNAIITAAGKGIHEVVEAIIKIFPDAIYATDPVTGGTIFHLAARNRFENVFNLIYRINEQRNHFYDSVDSFGNNFMHMCAKNAPSHKLDLVSGVALQMQRELQWFKEMKIFVSPSHRTSAQILFTEEHRDLKSKGEKWMKDTATSCSIAATLITTVVFAAVFTVPGNVNESTGIPIFLKAPSFIVFAISDSVSLFTAITSLLMFLSILTSRCAEEDFLYVLPRILFIGLLTLLLSISFMMVAFCTTIYITLTGRSSLLPIIPAAVLGCLPVGSFVFLLFPLLVDVMFMTYGPSILGKKNHRAIY